MYTPKQGKTIGQSDAIGPMQALEFLVELFIVITLPEETGNKQSRNVSQDEKSFQQYLSARALEDRSHFKLAACGLARTFCSSNRGYLWQLERSN